MNTKTIVVMLAAAIVLFFIPGATASSATEEAPCANGNPAGAHYNVCVDQGGCHYVIFLSHDIFTDPTLDEEGWLC